MKEQVLKACKAGTIVFPAVTSPLKAVPVAVLLAMSPMTTTSAKEIMRTDSVKAPTEQVQTQPTVFFEQKIKTNKGLDVTLRAINTKGEQGTFDKITLNALGYDFDVKDIFDTSIKVLGSDGNKEPLIRYTEVRTETMYKGKMSTFNFTDPYVAAYVKALVEHEANKSSLKEVKPQNILYVMDFTHRIEFPKNDDDINFIMSEYSQNENVNYGNNIGYLTQEIQGSHDKYKIKFYDTDGNTRTFENITIQKNKDPEFIVKFLGDCSFKTESVDDISDAGSLVYIHLNHDNRIVSNNIIFDDDLGNFLINMTKAENANTSIIVDSSDVKIKR